VNILPSEDHLYRGRKPRRVLKKVKNIIPMPVEAPEEKKVEVVE